MKRFALACVLLLVFATSAFADTWGVVQGGANDGLNYYNLEWQTGKMSYTTAESATSPYTIRATWSGTTNYAVATTQIPIVGTIYRVEVPAPAGVSPYIPIAGYDMFLSGLTPVPVNAAGSTIFSMPNLAGTSTAPTYTIPSAATPWITAPVYSLSTLRLDVYNTHDATSGNSIIAKRGGVSIYWLPADNYGTLAGTDIKYYTWNWFSDYYGRYVADSAIPIIGQILGFQQRLGDLTPKTGQFTTYMKQGVEPTTWVSNKTPWAAPTGVDKLFNAGVNQTITSGTSLFVLPGTSGASMYPVPIFNWSKLTLQIATADGGVSPQQKRGWTTVFWK